MSSPEELEQAAAELREQRDLIGRAGAQVAAVTSTTTSRDRMITVTIDGQGQLTGLKLSGTRWQKLAAPDLCAKIVETARAAHEEATRKSMAAFMEFVPSSLGGVMGGGVDLDQMLSEALRAGDEPLFPEMNLGRRRNEGDRA
ncbi:YbaB/EbfC family nucleoid-associated protein [Kineosporia sp. J2-2]|uniref:YbaB/EbfC family nucleoid-associated protein n=1 Tax=Kineosporia corallincola TaxID=2835133 RepID=A0ABS5TGL6_9ACTN|nr:YbaB/EbfC family nucleoid-associated protein [Kineosporia corallincola]MBT0770185.1 YbaB/EbfC family nucleoid-associated protein [Kineosporia corallincola]